MVWGVEDLSDTLVLSVFPLLVVAAGISDFLTLKIPNWINAVIAAAIIPFALYQQMPLEVFAWHMVAGIIMLIAGFLFFAFGLIGGGDAKMLAACGLWVGWENLAPFVLVTALAGGLLAVIMKFWQMFTIEHEVRDVKWLKRVFRAKLQLPYGVAIAVGGMIVFPATWWVQQVI